MTLLIPMLWLLLACSLVVCRKHVAYALNADPNIDIIDVNDLDGLPDICKGKECPKYTDAEVKLPSNLKLKDYSELNWISSSRYDPVDNSCLEGSKEMVEYYQELFNYFKGVNTMGLLMERTLPIRVIGVIDEESGKVKYCHLMFYIAEMYSVNAPAPLSVGIFVGHNWPKRCYSYKVNGNYSWRRALKIHKALKTFLRRKKIRGVTESELILDIYSGYGVPNSKKHSEVLLCVNESNSKYTY